MRNEIAFGVPRERTPRLPYRFHRLSAGERVVGVVLSPAFCLISYHWIDGANPIVHSYPHCPCQSKPLPIRERGYIAFALTCRRPRGEQYQSVEVLEVPESLRDALETLGRNKKSLRGLRIEAKRKEGKKNGPVKILQSEWLDPADQMEDLDVRTFVEDLWRPYLWQMSAPAKNVVSPVDDGPDAEIPCE